jgi:hypothetical protein
MTPQVDCSSRVSELEFCAVRGYLTAVTCLLLALVVPAISLVLPTTGHAAELASATSGWSGLPTLLPDLDQEAPSGLEVRPSRPGKHPRYVLGFRSAVRNVGQGPLIVMGSRADRGTLEMQADQLVETVDAGQKRVPDVGRLRYVVSPGHRHWHYLEFDRYELQSYELRPVHGDDTAIRDRKTGFCLGDRYRVRALEFVGSPAKPVHTGFCGLSRPGLLHVLEGISVGYGDDYSAFLEGQSLPLGGLANGRCLLIHRVNEGGGLRELSHANNAASLLIALRWRQGRPDVRVLARCPKTATCFAKRSR